MGHVQVQGLPGVASGSEDGVGGEELAPAGVKARGHELLGHVHRRGPGRPTDELGGYIHLCRDEGAKRVYSTVLLSGKARATGSGEDRD